MSLSMKRIGLRLITAALSAVIMVTTILPGTQLKAGADTIDTGNEITAELEHIKAQIESAKKKAIDSYNKQNTAPLAEKVPYRVLFVKFRDVQFHWYESDTSDKVLAKRYKIDKNSQIDSVIDAAVKNFESSVEHYTNNNIDIITKTISVDRYIDLGAIQGRQSKRNGKYMPIYPNEIFYGNIKDSLTAAERNELTSPSYDSVFLFSGREGVFGIEERDIRYSQDAQTAWESGMSYVQVVDSRKEIIQMKNARFNGSEKYFCVYTTGLVVHEWLHHFDNFYLKLFSSTKGFNFPKCHDYDSGDGSAGLATTDRIEQRQINGIRYFYNPVNGYMWPQNTNGTPNILDDLYIAILGAKVIDTRNNNHKIGMYPEFWKLTPSKTNRLYCLGTYTMQNKYSKQFVSFVPSSSGSGGAFKMMDQKNSAQSNLQLKLYYYPSDSGDRVRIAPVNDPQSVMQILKLSNVWADEHKYNIEDFDLFSVFRLTATGNGAYYLTYPRESSKRIPLCQNGSFFGFELASESKHTDPKYQWVFTKVNTDNGKYFIKNAADDKVLTVTSNGKDLTMDTFSATSSQTWNVTNTNDGFFALKPSSSNNFLTITADGAVNGAGCAVYSVSRYESLRQWRFQIGSDGLCTIVSKANPSKCMMWDSAKKTVKIAEADGSLKQKWIIQKAQDYVYRSGRYAFKTSDGKYLGYSGSKVIKTSTPYYWRVMQFRNGFYEVIAEVNSNRPYLDLSNAWNSEGNSIGLCYFTGYYRAQTWSLNINFDGTVSIRPMLTSKRGLAFKGTNAVLSSKAENFSIVRA
ncbi:MAG: RICIN domain-containing protein [Ruminococcus sp.]|nr:RICIN domain-containing protein [Ruminococcus sp.]